MKSLRPPPAQQLAIRKEALELERRIRSAMAAGETCLSHKGNMYEANRLQLALQGFDFELHDSTCDVRRTIRWADDPPAVEFESDAESDASAAGDKIGLSALPEL